MNAGAYQTVRTCVAALKIALNKRHHLLIQSEKKQATTKLQLSIFLPPINRFPVKHSYQILCFLKSSGLFDAINRIFNLGEFHTQKVFFDNLVISPPSKYKGPA